MRRNTFVTGSPTLFIVSSTSMHSNPAPGMRHRSLTSLFVLFALSLGAQGQVAAPKDRQARSRPEQEPARQVVAAPAKEALPTDGKEKVGPTDWMNALMRDGEREGLPYIQEVRRLGPGATGATAHLSGTRYVPLSAEEIALLPGLGQPGQEPEVAVTMAVERKRPVALVRIYPYRRNPITGAMERLADHQLDLVEERRAGDHLGQLRSGSYADHSKLASGSWYRFSVYDDGVYKLSWTFLRDLGINMDDLSSDRINVYGNHAGLLPYKGSHIPANDLLANAIEVVDGGDGVFGPNDYILFYASGAQDWVWNATDARFEHTKNTYTDSACYFIGLDIEDPERIMSTVLSTEPATDQVTTFADRQTIDRDLVNLLKSGRTWVGDTYNTLTPTYNYNFSVPNLRSTEPWCVKIDVLSRTIQPGLSTWNMTVSGQPFSFQDSNITGHYAGPYARQTVKTFCGTTAANNLQVNVAFDGADDISSVGWMNFLELNCRRDLRMVGDQLRFRDPVSMGAGHVGEFTVDQASSVTRIWDITVPWSASSVPFTDNGAQKVFRVATDTLREFIAFKNSGFLTPVAVGPVPNQDLHAVAEADMVIVSPELFLGQAQRLADRRTEEGLSVVLVTPQQIYNEFSSGQRDATAIKRFMKMLYDRAGMDPELMTRYLLLFGDGSYNNISIAGSNQNWIPSYQSYDSWVPSSCFTTDDYFCLLDDNEGEANGDIVDVGVGRLPISSLSQAREVVDKILNYDRLMLNSVQGNSCANGSDGGAADWRNWTVFVSDDQTGDGCDNHIHMNNSNLLANLVESLRPCLNVNKIYLDAYMQVSTPGGQRYPEAQEVLRSRVQKGALVVNYVGHGGEVGWAHERLLDVETILGWTNFERLPLFVTATCEFTRWDDPARTSAGEYVMLNPHGGGIALMTTTRIAYSGANQNLAMDFYTHVFQRQDEQGHAMRLGDIYRRTKVDVAGEGNYRNFALLGDPSIRLAMTRQSARITAITDTLGNPLDTLMARATVRITGEVTDTSGQVLTDFNGTVLPTVFDKVTALSTLDNDHCAGPYNYTLRKNIIYRGRATVTNGQFTTTFVVPQDINYAVGPGRISIYAESLSDNACGYDNSPLVGASDPNATADANGPVIELYMNDETFVPGGITDEKPLLLARLHDDNGINTLGSSIGHDLTATIDQSTENAIVLNDVYEADKDTYKSGTVRYRLSNLAEGSHTLDLKAWDVFNNSSRKTLDFVVAPSAEMALEHVLNYPNPFTTSTQFFFEHNRPCNTMDVQVQVFTVSGRLVKTLNRQLQCDGYRSEPMAWDGLDDAGDKLARGVYVYRLSVATLGGETADHVDKLVILR